MLISRMQLRVALIKSNSFLFVLFCFVFFVRLGVMSELLKVNKPQIYLAKQLSKVEGV